MITHHNNLGKLLDSDVYFAPNCAFAEYTLHRKFNNVPIALKGFTLQVEKQKLPVQKGPIVESVPVNVTRNDAATTLNAAAKRVDVKPQHHCGPATIEGYRKLLRMIGEQGPLIKVTVPEVEKWLKAQKPDKELRMRKLLSEPRYWQANTRAELFAKTETTLKPNGSDARVIHQYGDEANLEFGIVSNILNERLALRLSEDNDTFHNVRVIYPCGMGDKELAELRARQKGAVIEGDYSNQDATHPVQVRRLNACVFKRLGAPEWWLREYIEQENCIAYSRQLGLQWTIKGQNHSGECMVTINNVCLNAANNLASTEVISDDQDLRVLVYGDDVEAYTTASATAVAEATKNAAEGSGMTYKYQIPERNKSTFLQTRIFEADTNVIPVPKIGRILAKLNIRPKLSEVPDREYMAGKYLSAAYKLRFLPLIRDTLTRVTDALSDKPHVEDAHKFMDARSMRDNIDLTSKVAYDTVARDAIYSIYGISMEEANECFVEAGIGVLQTIADGASVSKALSLMKRTKNPVKKKITSIGSAASQKLCLLDT